MMYLLCINNALIMHYKSCCLIDLGKWYVKKKKRTSRFITEIYPLKFRQSFGCTCKEWIKEIIPDGDIFFPY